jgi:GTPase
MRKPIVALVGRPNVGKSTLFNRLIEERRSVTSDVPGTTRDRIIAEANWNGVTFVMIDTGGIERIDPTGNQTILSTASTDFVQEIRIQSLIAIEEADVIVMLVDAEDGITAGDEEVANILRRVDKPILLAANKSDNENRAFDAYEFYSLGLGEGMYPISALHGLGTGDLLDAIVEKLRNAPPENLDPEDDGTLKIAIVGRPNVGKSSLVNRLLGQERVIVSPIAGTTRDAIDTHLTWESMPITLIDTAGIRRRGSIEPGIEQFSVIRAFKAMERADVVLLVIDGEEGITAQDLHIAGMVQEAIRSCVIVVNKWDAIVDKDEHTMREFTALVRHRFDFMDYAPVLFISAKTGRRIHTVLSTAAEVQEERMTRIPTSALNKLIREAMEKHAPSSSPAGRLKIYYSSQVRINPPMFLFHVNDTEFLHFSYERYLENQIREHFRFLGTPIRMSFRNRKRRELGGE